MMEHFAGLTSLYGALVDHAAAGLVLLDRAGIVRFANPTAERQLGASLVGVAFASRFADGFRESCAAFVGQLGAREPGAGPTSFSGAALRADGSMPRLEIRGVNALDVAGIEGLVLTVVDLTPWYEERQQLIQRAYHDELTGLPNRVLVEDRLRQAIRTGGGTAAIADMDRFKTVNDAFGHPAGDMVLREFARRVVAALPGSVTVGRMGGDEFLLIFPNVRAEDARVLMERALRHVAGPVDLGGQVVLMPTLSVGMMGLDGRGATQIWSCCDSATYVAKSRGRNQVVIYGDDVRRFVSNRREMADRISELTEQNEQLRVLARTDPLTGVGNRRPYEEIKDEVFGAEGCPWTQGAVVFVDVDWFGKYNKRYGDNPAGDEALRRVAEVLSQICRQSDLVFRKGGEEFVAVLLNVDTGMAVAAAERIRGTVQALGIVHADSDEGVLTVTVGVSVAGPDDGKSVKQCLAEAGDLVMAAKLNNRRNEVHVGR